MLKLRTIVSLSWFLVLAGLAASGCGESASKKAAAKTGEQVELARRHYLRGVALFAVPPASAEDAQEVLAAWQEAKRILTAALADGEGAGRSSAQGMLADVEAALGEYHLHAARAVLRQSEPVRFTIETGLAKIAPLAAEAAFLGRSDTGAGEGLEELLSAAQAKAAAAAALKEQLIERRAELRGRIEAIEGANEQRLAEARRLREASAAAAGLKGLDILSEAEAVERQMDLQSAAGEELAAQVAALEDALVLADGRLEAATRQLADIEASLLERSRAGARRLARRGAAADELLELGTNLTADAARLAELWSRAFGEFEQAVEAFERARSAAAGALAAGRRAPGGAAAVARAREGRIQFRAAETRREVLAEASEMSDFARRIEQGATRAGVQVPRELAEIPAGLPREEYLTEARTAYEAARDAYDSLASAARGPQGEATGPWPYRCEQARALLGLYRLSADAGRAEPQHLDDARTVLRELLEEHQGRPAYLEPAYKLEELLSRAG